MRLYTNLSDINWRFRRKLSTFDDLICQIRELSKFDIDYCVDLDHMLVVDFTHNQILAEVNLSESMYAALFTLTSLKDYFYYSSNLEHIFHYPSLFNRYKSLKQRFYGRQKNYCH